MSFLSIFIYSVLYTPIIFRDIYISLFLKFYSYSESFLIFLKFLLEYLKLSSNTRLFPIALITYGPPIFSSFILITVPIQLIGVVAIILWSFTDIASAPAFLNILTISIISVSCTIIGRASTPNFFLSSPIF